MTPAEQAVQLGHALMAESRFTDAVAAYRQAAQLQPGNVMTQVYLAVALHQAGALQEAEQAYRAVLRLEKGQMHAVLGLGGVLNELKRAPEAEALLRPALEAATDPKLKAALEHGLGVARGTQNDHADAVAHFDRALALFPELDAAEYARADALSYLSRLDEAVESFRKVIKRNPMNFGAHRDLNQLLYRMKRDDEFLASYDEAARLLPEAVQFPLTKASFLLNQNRNEEALEIFERVRARAPDNVEALSGIGVANLNLKNFGAAISAMEKGLALRPGQITLLNTLSATLLAARDAKKSAMMAEYALSLVPYDQTALALLGSSWRLLNDEREFELNGYDRFIQVYDLEPPEGYADMEAFNRDLNASLDRLHPDAREYVDQSLRNGTQTLGNIFEAGHDLVGRLKRRIDEAVARYIRDMPEDARHPLLSRRAGEFRFTGSWSSRLRDCGYHTNHLHPQGWISSAYYVALPELAADAEREAGWIKFGEPCYDLGFSEPVRRAVEPKPGRLVLFPSYMWHGTVPFRSARTRTTIAFDAVPR